MDVDTGIDDMIALLIAATSPELNLRGVTCVAGNVEIQHVARNTGKVLRMVGRGDVPVSIGASRPLQRRLRTAQDTHGPTGTGYVELRGEDRHSDDRVHRHPGLALPGRAREPPPRRGDGAGTRSVDQPRPAALNGTDLATGSARLRLDGRHARGARQHHRDRRVERVRRPGGGRGVPVARNVVRHLFPLDATQDIIFTMADLDALPDTHLAGVVRDAVRYYVGFHRKADGIEGAYLHDPVALIAALLRPDLVTDAVDMPLACDTSSDPHRAGSLLRVDDAQRDAVHAAVAIDAEGMKAELLERLARAVAAGRS